ncbi:hypothetical protein DesfrDRAFT_1306 [Solidesulfovibrio fructosivorans JJ]]|uniref:Uncharacterized protein n=1 Tax=Solidesulfovibrio fructosivorans JJ] TaxID=596151 RepID=E1JUK7_SOLFR|nr:hypothetical protein [Solidesulfovibrio fructosivorans]EFL52137.1 hypothetical protein DesfrDRAFT_1306 [Solidesulfovibrio fructosivorans JJ]]
MYKLFLPIMLAVLVWALPAATQAADPAAPAAATSQKAPTAAPPKETTTKAEPANHGPSNPATDAAEARYRAWVDREHAADAAEFAKEKNKIEDKYKGYVRPKHDKKKNAKAEPATPKGN